MKFASARTCLLLVASSVSCGQAASNGPTPLVNGGASSIGGTGASAAGSGFSSTAGTSSASGGANVAGSPGAAGASAGSSAGGAGAAGAGGAVGSGCTGAGTICWDFEEGTIPTGWTPYRNEFNGTLLVDNTRAHGGKYALHAKDMVGGTEGVQGGPKKTIRYTLPANFGPLMWGRAWVYTTPTRPNSHTGLFNARYPRPGTTDTDITKLDWYELAMYTQDYMAIWHPPEPPGYPEWVSVTSTQVVLDAWVCLEWEFDGQNGTAPEAADPRVWLNGAELAWPMQFVFSDPATTVRPTQEKATNFTTLETGMYAYQGIPAAMNVWIDDLAVGKERIGCQ